MRRLTGWVLAWGCMLGVHAQEFVDAPYVSTPPSVVEAMLKLGGVGANDYVIDLGSGDGRNIIAAAKQAKENPAPQAGAQPAQDDNVVDATFTEKKAD